MLLKLLCAHVPAIQADRVLEPVVSGFVVFGVPPLLSVRVLGFCSALCLVPFP